MKKTIFLLIISVLLCIGYHQKASALGIGAYGGFSYSEPEFEEIDGSISSEGKNYWIGGGLVLDTAVAKKNLFNYRLNFGLGQLTQTSKNGSFDDGTKGFQLDIINSFGFGIVKVSFMRMWLGPQVGLRFSYIDYSYSYNTIEQYRLSILPGAVLGFNFNIGSVFTIGIDGGFRYNLGVAIDSSSGYYYNETSYTVLGPEGFVNLSILFRIGDTYSGSRSRGRSGEPSSTRQSSGDAGKKAKGEKLSDDDDYWFGD